jgi:hypothetical protein
MLDFVVVHLLQVLEHGFNVLTHVIINAGGQWKVEIVNVLIVAFINIIID